MNFASRVFQSSLFQLLYLTQILGFQCANKSDSKFKKIVVGCWQVYLLFCLMTEVYLTNNLTTSINIP